MRKSAITHCLSVCIADVVLFIYILQKSLACNCPKCCHLLFESVVTSWNRAPTLSGKTQVYAAVWLQCRFLPLLFSVPATFCKFVCIRSTTITTYLCIVYSWQDAFCAIVFSYHNIVDSTDRKQRIENQKQDCQRGYHPPTVVGFSKYLFKGWVIKTQASVRTDMSYWQWINTTEWWVCACTCGLWSIRCPQSKVKYLYLVSTIHRTSNCLVVQTSQSATEIHTQLPLQFYSNPLAVIRFPPFSGLVNVKS